MAINAPQIQYRQEWIKGFEQRQPLLRMVCVNESVIKGNQAVFLVADSGGAEAVTRGVNGLIPARNDNNTQSTCTLAEWHDLPQKTGFNIFESQGDQRRIMQDNSRGVISRKHDQLVITELNTGTQDTGAAVPATLGMALRATTILGNAKVPFDGNISAVITPAFYAYLLQVTEFSNVQYVNMYPIATNEAAWKDQPMMFRWLNVNWIVHPSLPGAGTNAEKCFMFHRDAIGSAINTGDINALSGYEEEQDYYWARTSVFMGSKLLQNTGVVVMNHDGSALIAE